MNKISLRIADLRKKAKVTQQELADSIGVSFQTISKWLQKISGTKNWNIFCRHERVPGMTTMFAFLFHRYGRLINQFLY